MYWSNRNERERSRDKEVIERERSRDRELRERENERGLRDQDKKKKKQVFLIFLSHFVCLCIILVKIFVAIEFNRGLCLSGFKQF